MAQHWMPARETRRVLVALLAYLALLMPALLPYGAHPAHVLVAAVAPHTHAAGIDAHAPHDHGGGTHESVPADAPFLLPHAAFAALLPERPELPGLARATAASAAATPARVHPSDYEPGRPRGPPAHV